MVDAVEKSQIDRFKEAARQLGCEEDEAAFDEKLRHIAKQKPSKETPKATGKAKQWGV
jgi:hypothetical protein